jgi:DNA replication and repair protein RecF
MLIKTIHIDGVRNLQVGGFNCHPEINVFLGTNGSGKTSLLESICFLAMGRSLRTSKSNNIINFNRQFASVAATYSDQTLTQDLKIMTMKHRSQDKVSKIGGAIASVSEVAALTPTQIINDETSRLVFKDPEGRRKFLDWLVFYSNNNYHQLWRDFNKVLQQRNRLLKMRVSKLTSMLDQMDVMFAGLSDRLAAARRAVWQNFQPVWQEMSGQLNIGWSAAMEIRLFDGWAGDLLQQLQTNRATDLKFGSTCCGPHKADLRVLINNSPAKEILSRGQGKVLSMAMILARAKFITTIADRSDFVSVLLVDDLCAELDDINVKQAVKALCALTANVQVFITGADKNKLLAVLPKDRSFWFSVGHGQVESIALENNVASM